MPKHHPRSEYTGVVDDAIVFHPGPSSGVFLLDLLLHFEIKPSTEVDAARRWNANR
jgi:hypothetical protein